MKTFLRSKILRTRVTVPECANAQAAADNMNVTMSDYLRRLLYDEELRRLDLALKAAEKMARKGKR
jgi:hypothetical protein